MNRKKRSRKVLTTQETSPKAAAKKTAVEKKSATAKNTSKKTIQKTTPQKRTARSSPILKLGSARTEQVVVIGENKDKHKLLDDVLKKSGFWFVLEGARFHANVDKDHFQIVIKPDLNAFEFTGSNATDPQLIESLIDQLHERGYTQVVVAESRNSFDLWLENRDVQILADLLGYQYVTPAGRPYDLIDLAEDLVPGPFAEGSLLQGTQLSRRWLEADFRIIFAKNKTDDENAYYLCLDNLLSVLPLRDKDYHYRHRLKREDVLLALLKNIPVDFCLIDGYISNHGNAGTRAARPIETHTCIAGEHLLLTDHAAALKMGVDPNASRIHAKAVGEIGLPEFYRIEGDLTPYHDWINVHPLLLDSVRRRQQWPELVQVLQPWLQTVDQESFPFKDPINEQLNRIVSRYLARVDDNPTVFWSLIALNHLIGLIHQGLEAWRIMYWKDHLWRQEVPLNISLDSYSLKDYEAIVAYLEPLAQQTLALNADSNGLRWTYHDDGSVLFEFSRIIPVEYDTFVNRVDIAKSIQYMNDYIGGLIVPVQQDDQGRSTHQAERNLYLPQPNYLALYQGQEIDVSKLEHIRYRAHEQSMFWKTVKSENGSARYDDGIVRFVRRENGETFVTIFGRQQFTLPLFWQLVNLDNYPALKDILFTHAYTTFFTHTLSNFEAVYEGRDVRIGKAWNPLAGEPDTKDEAKTPSDQIVALLTHAQDFIQRHLSDKKGFLSNFLTTYHPQPEYVDEDGFAHFKQGSGAQRNQQAPDQADPSEFQARFSSGKAAAEGFWNDLYQAIQKDIGIR